MTEQTPTPKKAEGLSLEDKFGCGVVAVLVVIVLAVVIWAKTEDNRIYGPVREAERRVEAAEEAARQAQRDAKMEALTRRSEAAIADIRDAAKNPPTPPPLSPADGVETARRSMSYTDCLAQIQGTAAALGQAPINIVETDDVRIVRFNARDGSVLITCSRADRTMLITRSPHRG